MLKHLNFRFALRLLTRRRPLVTLPRFLSHNSQVLTLPRIRCFEGRNFSSAEIPVEETNEKTIKESYGENYEDENDVKDEQEEFGGVNIPAIAQGDPEIEKALKILILEVDIFRQDGALVPSYIEEEDWRELLMIPHRPGRLRYLTYLFKTEKKVESAKRMKEQKRLERIARQQEEMEKNAGHIQYGFAGSTIFLRIYDTTMDHYLNKNLMNACLFSQHIVFDCAYDEYMNKIEAQNCAKQLSLVFHENRKHKQPFHIQFCNVNRNSFTMRALQKFFPPLNEPYFPMFLTEENYLDLYPKEKLVYLTPNCKNDLVKWNHDDIYIIGTIVDKSNPKPLSLAKAKQEGLRMAKLPLERHLLWGCGGKALTLNQMILILLDVRATGSWDTAFQHIPRRKIILPGDDSSDMEEPIAPPKRKTFVMPGEVQVSNELIRKIHPRKISLEKISD